VWILMLLSLCYDLRAVCVQQMANNARVLGIVLMHATGTTAGVFEMLKEKVCTSPSCHLYLLRTTKSQTFLNRNSLLPSVLFITCLVLFVKFSCLLITINEWSACFIDNELEVGDCRKEDFCCKLSRASQVWHGMSSHHFV